MSEVGAGSRMWRSAQRKPARPPRARIAATTHQAMHAGVDESCAAMAINLVERRACINQQ